MATRVNIVTHPSQMSLEKVDSNILLELFPFAIILDHEMHVKKCGEKLLETWLQQNPDTNAKTFYNAVVTKHFKLRRPKGIQFNWKTVVQMNTVLFELELIRGAEKPVENSMLMGSMPLSELTTEELLDDQMKSVHLDEKNGAAIGAAVAAAALSLAPDGTASLDRGAQGNYRLLLKGQMRYIIDIDSIVFLCSPM